MYDLRTGKIIALYANMKNGVMADLDLKKWENIVMQQI